MRGWMPRPTCLKISQRDGKWACAEVTMLRRLMDDAAKSLAGAIEAWLAGDPMTPGFSGKSNGTPINSSPETVRETQMGEARQYGEPAVTTLHPEAAEQWLKAVLAEWVSVVRQRLPLRIEKELDKVRRIMRNELSR
jgi:hypothetical protein